MQVVEANGARIPAIGLGTMTLKGDTCVEIVSAALGMGYRHLDTAQMYGNEAEVGQGLKASGLKREDVFLTTKVWHSNLAPADFERTFEESLKKLDLPFVDLLLIHWPNGNVPLAGTMAALCRTAQDKRARHVGVANFTIPMIEEAVRLATVPLVTNQIEVHPYIDQRKVIDTCRKHGLSVTAYCPLARGGVPSDETLKRIGAAHGKSASQVALRWLVQQGLVAIPRTSNKDRLPENLAVFDFTLSEAEMGEIAALRKPNGRLVSPPHAPQWDA
ncbi:aldo/keto reductase [Rhodoplanes roseus]|uniref:2,5-didehydrogluconate reductase n=1 Tax=Rhodoplanes roseus TaxID=29409 RepID=A0A327KQ97_9BRAD|nr:aldo/keto reductase [Rhodoplanes roseus]RAI40591.1 2,5-didehydrogluconate reductase [Rhodoplanes roseus]